jgi:predicted membrane metal-binding protein
MERFPVLNLILRFGIAVSAIVALIAGTIVVLLAYRDVGWPAIPIAAVVALLVFGVAKSYVELVTIVTEMLVPR